MKSLLPPDNPKIRTFYTIPKIHKPIALWTVPHKIPPGRPITSDIDSVSYGNAKLIEFFLHLLSIKHPSYVKDSFDLLQKLRRLNLPSTLAFITLDVSSLYTNIDTHKGVPVIKHFLEKYQCPNRPDSDILKLLELNLKYNDFEFNNKCYVQTKGTAMGKIFAPSYANIYLADWEEKWYKILNKKIVFYFRYLDDLLIGYNGTEKDFETDFEAMNNIDSDIKLSGSFDQNCFTFLDIYRYKDSNWSEVNSFQFKLYLKPVDNQNLIHADSAHAPHIFRGIIKSQLIRFKRICSTQSAYLEARNGLFASQVKRGYDLKFLLDIDYSLQHNFKLKSKKYNTFVDTMKHFVNTGIFFYKITCHHCGKSYIDFHKNRNSILNRKCFLNYVPLSVRKHLIFHLNKYSIRIVSDIIVNCTTQIFLCTHTSMLLNNNGSHIINVTFHWDYIPQRKCPLMPKQDCGQFLHNFPFL